MPFSIKFAFQIYVIPTHEKFQLLACSSFLEKYINVPKRTEKTVLNLQLRHSQVHKSNQ
jgi:hypothetical protein